MRIPKIISNNNKNGNSKREAAFSTVRHQIQDKFSWK